MGINAHLLNLAGTYRSAGISSYTHHLVERLPEAAPDLDLHVFASGRSIPRISSGPSWHASRLPTHSPVVRVLWEQTIQPWQIRRLALPLLHSLAFVQPLATGCRSVVTVYDLSFLVYGRLFRSWHRRYLTWGTRLSTRRAQRVIAISESTKRDLIRAFGLPPEKIRVIPCGVDERFLVERRATGARPRRPLPERFVLFVGTLEARKNVTGLIRAFARAKRAAALPHHLVLVGAPGPRAYEIDRVVEQAGVRDHVVLTGYVARDELPLIYGAAELFVYPSLYEGFGLPPLEALASGVPVIVSDAASLPEVVGDAGVYVRPHDERALAEAMASVLADSGLRQDLSARGRARARQFSWARAAASTAALYREVLAGA